VEKFTEEVLRFLDVKFDPPYEKLLDVSNGVEFPNWCAGAGLNITEMCLDRWQTDEMKDQPAIIWEGEEGFSRLLTYKELREQAELCAAGLHAVKLKKGDAIGICMPMIPETIIALLAINRIGAIAVPVFSGYGVEAIASRMDAVGAKALFTCNTFPRRGKNFNSLDVADKVVFGRPSTIQKLIIVNRPFQSYLSSSPQSYSNLDSKVLYYDKFINFVKANVDLPLEKLPEPTLAEDPLIILYTSGTTGKPKGIAHTHASFPIKAAQDMTFGTDVGRAHAFRGLPTLAG
jgi:acetyl-CoA synthetase